ncbi:MAG: hypothetical protein ACRD0U_15545, partial [Acidimicrobiales bacterium]
TPTAAAETSRRTVLPGGERGEPALEPGGVGGVVGVLPGGERAAAPGTDVVRTGAIVTHGE